MDRPIQYCLNFAGTILLLLSTVEDLPVVGDVSFTLERVFAMVGLAIVGGGNGIMLPCLVTFMGDQQHRWHQPVGGEYGRR